MTIEHDKARAWRESWGFTQVELGEMIGYSREAVWWMEAGRPSGGPYKTISATAWLRYKTACAAADATLRTGKGFNWEVKE